MSHPTSARNAPVWATGVLSVLGVVLVVVGAIYLAEPASHLPSFFPGHQTGSSHHHLKHGVVALLVGLIALAGAWLSTGHKKASND